MSTTTTDDGGRGRLLSIGFHHLGHDRYEFFRCADCGTEYPRIKGFISANGKAIHRCLCAEPKFPHFLLTRTSQVSRFAMVATYDSGEAFQYFRSADDVAPFMKRNGYHLCGPSRWHRSMGDEVQS